MKSRPVVSLNEQGEVIKEYHSAGHAALRNNLNHNTVIHLCNGKIKKNRRGLVFKWKDEHERGKHMKILSLDPSGNFKEGKGVTGWAIMEDGEITQIGAIEAKKYASDVEYWRTHVSLISNVEPNIVVMEGFRLYGHKKNEQTNSELETPQLIGCIKLFCWTHNIPLKIQFAVEVKNRWSDEVLLRKGILKEVGGRTYCNGMVTMRHSRDSIRHAIHYWRYRK